MKLAGIMCCEQHIWATLLAIKLTGIMGYEQHIWATLLAIKLTYIIMRYEQHIWAPHIAIKRTAWYYVLLSVHMGPTSYRKSH